MAGPVSDLSDLMIYSPRGLSDGIFYIIQASDSIRFDYSVEGDKVYLSSDILFDTLRILKLDNEYLWTHRTENTYIRDTVYVNNEEFHYKRLSN